MHYIICLRGKFQDNFRKFSREHHEDEACNAFQIGLIFRTPMDHVKDASNCLKLGTAFLYSAAMHMYALSANRVRKECQLLKPAFAAQIHSAQRWVPCTAMCSGLFHTMGLAAHTMGLVAHTIGLAALLEDGLVLEFLVMMKSK
jgi:hypothetical protein